MKIFKLIIILLLFTSCENHGYVKVYQINATDPEGCQITYSLTTDYGGLFKVNQKGEIFKKKNMVLDMRFVKKPMYLLMCDPSGLCDSVLLVLPIIKKSNKNEKNETTII